MNNLSPNGPSYNKNSLLKKQKNPGAKVHKINLLTSGILSQNGPSIVSLRSKSRDKTELFKSQNTVTRKFNGYSGIASNEMSPRNEHNKVMSSMSIKDQRGNNLQTINDNILSESSTDQEYYASGTNHLQRFETMNN